MFLIFQKFTLGIATNLRLILPLFTHCWIKLKKIYPWVFFVGAKTGSFCCPGWSPSWHSKRQEPQASTPMSSPVIILVVQGMKPKAQAGKYAIILLYSCLICNFIYIYKYPSKLHMYITYKPKPTVSFVTAKNRNSLNLQKYF